LQCDLTCNDIDVALIVRCGIDCKIFIPPTATSKGVLEYIWLEMVFSQSVSIHSMLLSPPSP